MRIIESVEQHVKSYHKKDKDVDIAKIKQKLNEDPEFITELTESDQDNNNG